MKIGNEYFMETAIIVGELEKRYPTPSLRLDAPRLKQVSDMVVPVMVSLRPVSTPCADVILRSCELH
jgi:hypothetical protein